MGFGNNKFATLWANKSTQVVVEKYEKYATASITTSKKNATSGNYEKDFAGKVRFIGNAFTKMKDTQFAEKDRIKLLEVETTNRYDKESGQNFINYICWDFEIVNNQKPSEPNKVDIVESDNNDPFGNNDDDSLPF